VIDSGADLERTSPGHADAVGDEYGYRRGFIVDRDPNVETGSVEDVETVLAKIGHERTSTLLICRRCLLNPGIDGG
jgi:hypothetical protein